MTVVPVDDAYKLGEGDYPVPLTQAKLNNPLGDMNLSKASAKLQS